MKLLDPFTLSGNPLPGTVSLFGTDAEILTLPETHQARLRFLDAVSTSTAYQAFSRFDFLAGDDGWGNSPFSQGGWARIEHFLAQDQAQLQAWLYQLSVPFSAILLLLPVFAPADSPAILTCWKMFYHYAWRLSHQDNFVAIDLDLHWCCYYHHDGRFSFASGPDWARLQTESDGSSQRSGTCYDPD